MPYRAHQYHCAKHNDFENFGRCCPVCGERWGTDICHGEPRVLVCVREIARIRAARRRELKVHGLKPQHDKAQLTLNT